MPVSHLGLTVSHIPTATSFYLAALQPLGYRFIGHQGDSIGLGVDSADFFITQAPIGIRPAPNHIAFLAEDRNVVRNCYTASLEAGGSPSGAPSYRNEDCTCFNAAVEDHDGNTVEFIFRQPHNEKEHCDDAAPSEHSRVLTWREGVDEDGAEDDAQSVASSAKSQESQASKATTAKSQSSLASKATTAKSRMQTALDLAKSTSQSVVSATPPQSTSAISAAPASSNFGSRAIIGTALGAAAGAALMFAITREESKNAKKEADHLAYMSSRSKPRPRLPLDEVRPPPPPLPRAETMPPSLPALSQAPKADPRDSRKFHHNYSTTESAYSRPNPRSTQAMRMLQGTGYNDNDDVPEIMPSHTNLRPHPTRSHTVDAVEYAPSQIPVNSSVGKGTQRASALLVDADADRAHYYLEAAPSTASRHSSRHGGERDDHRSSVSQRHHRRTSADHADKLKRHDSGISMYSARSHRDRGSEGSRRSSISTVRPRRNSAQDAIPLPPPPIGNNAPSMASRGASSCYHPAAISLPPSAASTSRRTADRDLEPELGPPRTRSVRSPPAKPYTHERDSVLQSWENFEAEESDGLGDVKTVLPEDSISCVDLGKPRRKHRSSKHSSSRSGRSEVSERTARPVEKERKSSVLGLALRTR